MINKKEKKRTSIDLTTENYEALNEFSRMYGSTYGRVINQMIELFIRLPLDVKKELADHCNNEVQRLSKSMETAGAFARQESKLKQSTYQQLAYFLSSGKTASSIDNMSRTYLKKGYVIYPSTMTVLKTKEPAECMYAGCVEIKNGERYFIFFTDKKHRSDYNIYDITLSQILNSGKAVVTAINISTPIKVGFFKIPHNTVGIQYLYRVEGNKLYCYKLNLSTEEKIVMSLCAVFPMMPDMFTELFNKYIHKKEAMYTCDETILEGAELRACIPNAKETIPLGVKERHLIENQFNANPKTVLFLETI